ncbi:hypothetical protein Mapa_010807 [Marchantia paleacea]|nr:hypothetical protein Mapa_010807 [Marchantia paleacea]
MGRTFCLLAIPTMMLEGLESFIPNFFNKRSDMAFTADPPSTSTSETSRPLMRTSIFEA